MSNRPPRLKIGLGQIPITSGDKRANLAAVVTMVNEAARARCDVLALPECCLAGWLAPAATVAAEPIPGPFIRKLAGLARHHKMAIVAGLEERLEERLFNSAVFLDETGKLLLRHRKINELEVARTTYSTGQSLHVTGWRGRTIGLSICADSWRPEVTDALCLMGANLIFSPCAWAVEPGGEAPNLAWITQTYRTRVGSRDLTIIAPNCVGPVTAGPWKGRVLQGNSLVVGPHGAVHATGPTNTPGLIVWDCP